MSPENRTMFLQFQTVGMAEKWYNSIPIVDWYGKNNVNNEKPTPTTFRLQFEFVFNKTMFYTYIETNALFIYTKSLIIISYSTYIQERYTFSVKCFTFSFVWWSVRAWKRILRFSGCKWVSMLKVIGIKNFFLGKVDS